MKESNPNDFLIEVQPLGGFDKPLSYSISKDLRHEIKVGSLVKIPLGARKLLGIVWSLKGNKPNETTQIRNIISLIHKVPVLSPDLTNLASWIANYYACSIESCLEAMIPKAVRDGMQPKKRRLVRLADSSKDYSQLTKRAPAQFSAIEFLRSQKEPVPSSTVLSKIKTSQNTIRSLVKKGIILESEENIDRVVYEDEYLDANEQIVHNLQLTSEQKKAVSEINEDLESRQFKTRLLCGVTGSGKTEVYFEAMQMALNQGGTILFLVPEVALAPQTVSRIRSRFKNEKIVVWHSHLASGERADAWRSIINEESKIVVGARSAIFAPLPKLRLLIVDEEHEAAYKQEDNPRYHARDIAVVRAKLNDATCLLGSATPSLESALNVQKEKYQTSKLSKRVDNRELPLIHLVDMRREADKTKVLPILSQQLVEALRDRISNKEQSILFLNRRGFNTTMLCPECGHVESYKDCSIALTYHRTDGYLRCHLCGYRKPAPNRCKKCNSFDLKKKGHGTQRIEDIVIGLLPKHASVRRVDADMMTKKNLFRETLSDFRKGKIDVLVGTQMIAKGLDFPKVTLVGVIDADLPLRMEDFRASERAFQMLVQVSGRAGRGNRAGEVFIQTYAPHSPSIQFARKSDLKGFTEDEMDMRKEFGYPPYQHLIRHLFRSRSESKVEYYANEWAKILENKNIAGLKIKGPAPAPLEKIKGYYRFHFFYFTASVKKTIKNLGLIRSEFPLDPDVHDILDVDAQQIG